MHAYTITRLVVQVTYRNILEPGPKCDEEVCVCVIKHGIIASTRPILTNLALGMRHSIYVFTIIKLIQS